jgi:3-oxoacyl-[acyl-carrier protein] reductase
MSVVHLSREVLPAMKRKRWGRLLKIGSLCVKAPHLNDPVILSNTARLAVVGLMKTMSAELAPYNITANILATGIFRTGRATEYRESLFPEKPKRELFWTTERSL